MKDREYWQRRTSQNTMPLAPGDQKLLLSSIFSSLDAIETRLDKLNEEVQSMGSKRSRAASKKLEANGNPEGLASGDA